MRVIAVRSLELSEYKPVPECAHCKETSARYSVDIIEIVFVYIWIRYTAG